MASAPAQQDPRVDAYVKAAAPFAQPILAHWRALVHAACPQATETIKWGMPHFEYKGKILSQMAAFKAHCGFGFWYSEALDEKHKAHGAMGQLGRITGVEDLPAPRELRAMIRRCVALIDSGIPADRTKRQKGAKPPPEIPADLAAALAANAAAAQHFADFPPGQQREYVDWLDEAKTVQTREKRLLQAVQWIAEGKPRNWKYMNC